MNPVTETPAGGGAQPARLVRGYLRRLRPPHRTPAVARLRVLILVTALAVVAVEALTVVVAPDPGYSLAVRTGWALLRVIGFLFLLRAVRLGRASARPFGLILAVTTVFAVARLASPREGSIVPGLEVIVGFAVLAVLCSVVVAMLYRSPAIAAHFEHWPARRHVPAWVLTARIAALAYAPLVLVPLLVAAGTLGDNGHAILPTVAALIIWTGLLLLLLAVVPIGSFFLVFGKAWARWLIGVLSVLVLVGQPLLCYSVLGWDGLLRDGSPLAVTAVLALVALHRSRGVPTWVRTR